MKKIILVLIAAGFYCLGARSQSTVIQYLSGTDKDHTVPWDFYCTKGMNSGHWTKIAVPSNWEQQGFGGYSYGHDKIKTDEQGLYKHRFKLLQAPHKKVFIVFEGAMTDTELKINGRPAGAVHRGGFYRFKYDITSLVKFGSVNLLEVTVSKISALPSVNKAERNGDFWTLGGIYRPVYLEIVPDNYIDRVAIDAKADGSFQLDVFAPAASNATTVEAQVQTLAGEPVGKPIAATAHATQEKYSLSNNYSQPTLWNPESPVLYQVQVTLKKDNTALHTVTQKFGFRTAELRPHDGFYVNGVKVIFKGVCRHSEWPETGRTLSKDISLLDVGLMKEMNMNAVRMSHYPPDQHFLDVCDSLGLFVLDELTGWQASYDTVAGRPLVKELVERDVNHPSVVIWDNGNEGGWNRALDNDFDLYDPQKRLVIHPWEKFHGTDTKHYPDYNYVVNSSLYSREIFFPTEFMHGLYDGGHGAGLDDFWNAILQHPYGAGGFLWSFHDEGIVRKDKKDSIDTDGNHAPDGILGPHREKEASFYTIKEIWSPIFIAQRGITKQFDGMLAIQNRYLYTDLGRCSFKWKLAKLPAATDTVTAAVIAATGQASTTLAPGAAGWLDLHLPANWNNNDLLLLTAYDPFQKEIFTWTWALAAPIEFATKVRQSYTSSLAPADARLEENDSTVKIDIDGVSYQFSKRDGQLTDVIDNGSHYSLTGGILAASVRPKLTSFRHYRNGAQYIIESQYEDNLFMAKWLFESGKPVAMQYSYRQRGNADFAGISFNYPETKIRSVKWMGRGPYRVWKNRLKGQQFGVWEKKYNDVVTGESWGYPEFKGYHADIYWAVIETTEGKLSILNDRDGMFLQLAKPAIPKGATNNNTSPPFPEGNIGFMSAIPPIGTKFQSADKMGPQSQPNIQLNAPVSGTLWFTFSPRQR